MLLFDSKTANAQLSAYHIAKSMANLANNLKQANL